MNLAQIERKFKQLEIKENYVRYFYNPNCQKVSGLKKHPYISELQRDYKQDVQTYGMDPFINQNKDENEKEKKGKSVATGEISNKPGGCVGGRKGSSEQNDVETGTMDIKVIHDLNQDDEYQSQLLESPKAERTEDNQSFGTH